MPERTIAHLDSNMPSIARVAALADYFGVSIDSLVGRKTDLPPDEELLLRHYRCLDSNGKEEILNYIDFLRSKYPVKKDSQIS